MATCVIILEDIDPAQNDGQCIYFRLLGQKDTPDEKSLAMVLAEGVYALLREVGGEAKEDDAA